MEISKFLHVLQLFFVHGVSYHPPQALSSVSHKILLSLRWILHRLWVNGSLDIWIKWKIFFPPMTRGLANVCCLDLVSSVLRVNLVSGHSTRHAHHFSICWTLSFCGGQSLPRDMERVALWTRRRHVLQGSWSQNGELLTQLSKENESAVCEVLAEQRMSAGGWASISRQPWWVTCIIKRSKSTQRERQMSRKKKSWKKKYRERSLK